MEENDEKKVDKTQGLREKCEQLAEKLENEKSPIKRALYSVKIQMLVAKIQKEIDISEIHEKYGEEREAQSIDAVRDREMYKKSIAKLAADIKKYQEATDAGALYDYDSKEFLYPKSEVQKEGGIDKYIESLRETGEPDLADTADAIEAVLENRRQLEAAKDALKSYKSKMKEIDSKLKKAKNKSSNEEKAMVLKKRVNIFDKIKAFFVGLNKWGKSEMQQMGDLSEMKKMQKEDLKALDQENVRYEQYAKIDYKYEMQKAYEEYQQKLEECKMRYEQEMEEIDADYISNKSQKIEDYKSLKEAKLQQLAADRRSAFLKDLIVDTEEEEERGNVEGTETEISQDGNDKDNNYRRTPTGRFVGPDGIVVDQDGKPIEGAKANAAQGDDEQDDGFTH